MLDTSELVVAQLNTKVLERDMLPVWGFIYDCIILILSKT